MVKTPCPESFFCRRYQRADMRFLVAFGFVGRHVTKQRRCISRGDSSHVYRGGDIADIGTPITCAWKRKAHALSLEPTKPDTEAENIHLPAGVIDVILPLHRVADGFEQVA